MMRHAFFGLVALATGCSASAGGPNPPLSGRWTQRSSGLELVLAPKFKLQPNVGITTGTNLGGSVGYGSMTRTTIVTEPMPMQVIRSMTLDVAADGRFIWVTVKRHAETPNGKCVKATRTEWRGVATQNSTRISFAVEGGTESWEKSCGGSGSAAIGPSLQVYTMALSAGQMRLSGGPATWTFKRG